MIKSVPLHVCVYTYTHTHLQAQYEICLPFIFKSQASLKASWNLNMCTQMQLSQLRACFLLPFVCSGFASIAIWIKHTSETLALFADWSSLLYSSRSVLNYFSCF